MKTFIRDVGAALLLLLCSAQAWAQSNPPLRVEEADGSPAGKGITKIVVSNGALTIAGRTATITTGGGGGDVVGPASATDNAVVRFDGTTGKLIQNSTAILGDDGSLGLTNAVAAGFYAGPSGNTSPTFRVVTNVASAVTGVSVTGRAAGAGATVSSIGGTEDLLLNAPSGANTHLQTNNISRLRTNSTETMLSSLTYFSISNGTIAAGTSDISLERKSASTFRIGQGGTSSTAAGNLIIGTTTGAIGSSGAGVLALSNSTAPTTSPADVVQVYSGDWNGAGTHALLVRNEEGTIYQFGSTFVSPGIQINAGATITKHLSATASLDFGATAAGTCDTLPIPVTGAADGDTVTLGIPDALAAADTYQTFFGWVSAASVVSVKRCNLLNLTTALSNPAAATVRADVWQH